MAAPPGRGRLDGGCQHRCQADLQLDPIPCAETRRLVKQAYGFQVGCTPHACHVISPMRYGFQSVTAPPGSAARWSWVLHGVGKRRDPWRCGPGFRRVCLCRDGAPPQVAIALTGALSTLETRTPRSIARRIVSTIRSRPGGMRFVTTSVTKGQSGSRCSGVSRWKRPCARVDSNHRPTA